MKIKIIFLIPIILLFILGCGKAVNPFIEKKIISAIQNHIKADNWSCKMTGDPNLIDVKFPDVTVSGKNISYQNAVIEQADLHFLNTEFNIHTKTIKSCEEAVADIKIKDSELTKLFQNYIKKIKNPAVYAENDLIILHGETEILKKDVSLEVKGRIKIENGINFILEPDSFKVMKFGLNIPNIAKPLINEKINPVFIIENNPYDIFIDSIKCEQGYFCCKAHFDSVKICSMFIK